MAISIDAARGMLVGLAVGDALGAPVEFAAKGTFEPVTGLRGGGAFGLPAGYWTDDTSMALCLADSLLARGGYDSFDVMERYCRWWRDGYRSSTGECFDIGIQTSAALANFERDPLAAGRAPRGDRAGNGCVMRLAPVVIAALGAGATGAELAAMARLSARDTHSSLLAEEATAVFAAMLAAAASGADGLDVIPDPDDRDGLAGKEAAASDADDAELAERARLRHEITMRLRLAAGGEAAELSPSGFVTATLEVAIWAFAAHRTFSDAVLAAVNEGGDADTIGAVAGQLAGARHGLAGIPAEWRSGLHEPAEFVSLADRLAAMPVAGIARSRFS